eukprot:gene21187-28087_t
MVMYHLQLPAALDQLTHRGSAHGGVKNLRPQHRDHSELTETHGPGHAFAASLLQVGTFEKFDADGDGQLGLNEFHHFLIEIGKSKLLDKEAQLAIGHSVGKKREHMAESLIAQREMAEPAVKVAVVVAEPAVKEAVVVAEPAIKEAVVVPEPAVKEAVVVPEPAVKEAVVVPEPAVKEAVVVPEPAVKEPVVVPKADTVPAKTIESSAVVVNEDDMCPEPSKENSCASFQFVALPLPCGPPITAVVVNEDHMCPDLSNENAKSTAVVVNEGNMCPELCKEHSSLESTAVVVNEDNMCPELKSTAVVVNEGNMCPELSKEHSCASLQSTAVVVNEDHMCPELRSTAVVVNEDHMCPELSKELVAQFAKDNTIMLAVCDWRMFETFGKNWMKHLQEIGIDYWIVGSTDRKTAEYLSSTGTKHPCFKFFEEGAEAKMQKEYT